jgi:hypothetical protein
MHHDDAHSQLTLVSPLAETLPTTIGNGWLKLLLTLTLNPLIGADPGVGWDPDIGLIGYQHLRIAELSAPGLESSLATFIAQMNDFSGRLTCSEHSTSTQSPNRMELNHVRV